MQLPSVSVAIQTEAKGRKVQSEPKIADRRGGRATAGTRRPARSPILARWLTPTALANSAPLSCPWHAMGRLRRPSSNNSAGRTTVRHLYAWSANGSRSIVTRARSSSATAATRNRAALCSSPARTVEPLAAQPARISIEATPSLWSEPDSPATKPRAYRQNWRPILASLPPSRRHRSDRSTVEWNAAESWPRIFSFPDRISWL
jgi:hypothetical protein